MSIPADLAHTGAPGRSLRHRFEGPFFRDLLVRGVKAFSPETRRRMAPAFAALFYAALPAARRTVEANLRRALPGHSEVEVRRTALSLFTYYARTMSNLYGLHLGQPLDLEVEVRGRENVWGVTNHGRGAVMVTGHLGAWQLNAYLLQNRTDVPPLTMAMAEEPNARVSEFEAGFREKFRIVYTTRSPFALLELASILRRAELVGMQLDRHTGGPRLLIPFFGHPAPFPLGPAVLARTAQVPLIPIFTLYQGQGGRTVRVTYEEPIEVARTRDRDTDLAEATAKVVAVYQRVVANHLDQWFNFHDFWSDAH